MSDPIILERIEWERALARIGQLEKLTSELVAALKSIDSEMDDTDHKFATRMFKAGEIIDAAMTRAKEAGYCV